VGTRDEAPVGGLRDEGYQELKQFADIVADSDCRNDQNLKLSPNSPPDSWPVCFTLGGGLSDILRDLNPSPCLARCH